MLIIGHRGARGLAPENTITSLQAALDSKVQMIEIDVRVSADGVALLCHDKSINKQVVASTNFLDLQHTKPDITTLEAALHFIDRRADIIIELKPDINLKPVIESIKPRLEKTWAESDIIIASFDYKLLKQIRQALPDVPLAVIEKWSGVRAGSRARRLGTKRIVMNQRWLWSGFIKSVNRSGYLLTAYTVNSPKQADKFKKAGIYAIVTDFPDKLN